VSTAEEREFQQPDHRPLGYGKSHPLLRLWAVSTGILFCLCAAWSIATPIGAAPDEPSQLARAASVARGEIVGSAPTKKLAAHVPVLDQFALQLCYTRSSASRCNKAVTVVTVPESFANFTSPGCFLNPVVPGGCDLGLRGSGPDATVTTYVGRYPPLYYAIVGVPSLAWHTDVADYLMRLVSGLLSALFLGLALALATVWSHSRLLVLAVAVAATPMVFIWGSVVNPSGLEIATAVCVWTGGLILVLDRSSHPPPSLIAATAVAAIVMVLTRGLSPLWLAVIAVSLAALAPRSLPVLIRQQNIRIAAGAVALAGAAAVAYIIGAHALSVYPVGQAVPAGTSEWGVIDIALGRTGLLVNELIGAFGWVETSPPLLVKVLWIVPALAVVVLGLLARVRRHAVVVAALIVTSVVLPTALMVSQAHNDGVVWQARDGFPLYAGILLVAGAVAGRNEKMIAVDSGLALRVRWSTRQLALPVVLAVTAAQLVDFVWALRRYTVGLGSVINPFARVRGGWSPPIPSVALVVLATVTCIVYGVWIFRLARPPRSTMCQSEKDGVMKGPIRYGADTVWDAARSSPNG
jgi:hypothetical protein